MYDTISTAVEQLGLSEYLEKDIAKELDDQGKDKNIIKQAKSKNNQIHEEIIGIIPAFLTIETLKTEYGKETEDMTQWIRKLKSIKANTMEKNPKVNRKIKKIFQNMD
ncbi:hypothetical protein LY90DRAFT_506343 [Neocallimastix californiae]|uniref:Uncharacterized protein n=1 Tax=Neocallimastix californiae TaxID=1754190 RepID=A0A1Y2DF83_9FUNG|nr:hypothetical protein LY90DRAFT_506343 [Neocallimastix californiae]|eukprot:ORY57943.1 hypothetical protein LY90DRAFT_506343 [Neocallimastix californiae]